MIFFPVTLGVNLSTGLVRECVKAWRVPKESLDSAEGIRSQLGVFVDIFLAVIEADQTREPRLDTVGTSLLLGMLWP